MAALTESTLRMLTNTGTYPESANYPNDGNGSDHDSLGLFQMRPQSGWGTVAELMDPNYQARAFFGGPDRTQLPLTARSARHSRLAARWTPAKPPKPSRCPRTPTGTATTQPVADSDPHRPHQVPRQTAGRRRRGGGPGVVAGGVPAAGRHLGAHQRPFGRAITRSPARKHSTPAATSAPPTAPRSSPR
jgi:hypothetical protein